MWSLSHWTTREAPDRSRKFPHLWEGSAEAVLGTACILTCTWPLLALLSAGGSVGFGNQYLCADMHRKDGGDIARGSFSFLETPRTAEVAAGGTLFSDMEGGASKQRMAPSKDFSNQPISNPSTLQPHPPLPLFSFLSLAPPTPSSPLLPHQVCLSLHLLPSQTTLGCPFWPLTP